MVKLSCSFHAQLLLQAPIDFKGKFQGNSF